METALAQEAIGSLEMVLIQLSKGRFTVKSNLALWLQKCCQHFNVYFFHLLG